jgi:hypothetical protein
LQPHWQAINSRTKDTISPIEVLTQVALAINLVREAKSNQHGVVAELSLRLGRSKLDSAVFALIQ